MVGITYPCKRYALAVVDKDGNHVFSLEEDGTFDGDPAEALNTLEAGGQTDSATVVAKALLKAIVKAKE